MAPGERAGAPAPGGARRPPVASSPSSLARPYLAAPGSVASPAPLRIPPALTRRLTPLAYRAGSRLAQALPTGVAASAPGPLGRALALALPGRRRTVARHLQRAHDGGLSRAALAREVRRAFDSYARYWIESFRLPGIGGPTIDSFFRVDGLEHVQAARAAGRGVILALPHLGGWDVAGAWLVRRGFPLTVVVEPVEPPELLAWFTALRSSMGLTVIPLGARAGRQVLAALRANEVVALLCDRDIAGGGVEVAFFGETTTLPAGPARLSLRTGAALLPTAVYFEGRHGHRAEIRGPLPLEHSGSLRNDVARTTQELATELESLIRAAPHQWHLFQPNWPSDPGYRG